MEGSANLLRAKKVNIDAGGSVARPESTISSSTSLFRWNPIAKKWKQEIAGFDEFL
jgi:hypothetical protein